MRSARAASSAASCCCSWRSAAASPGARRCCATEGSAGDARARNHGGSMLAFLFPGQGSQSLGMLAELATREPLVRATFDEASGGAGTDLWRIAQEGPESELNRTELTQPALLAAGVAVWRAWQSAGGAR